MNIKKFLIITAVAICSAAGFTHAMLPDFTIYNKTRDYIVSAEIAVYSPFSTPPKINTWHRFSNIEPHPPTNFRDDYWTEGLIQWDSTDGSAPLQLKLTIRQKSDNSIVVNKNFKISESMKNESLGNNLVLDAKKDNEKTYTKYRYYSWHIDIIQTDYEGSPDYEGKPIDWSDYEMYPIVGQKIK